MEQELILADLVVVEKRLERIEHDHRRGKKMDPEEHSLLIECHRNLENETPLRQIEDLATAHKAEDRIGTILVPDSRIDVLSDMHEPQKTIYAQVEYFLPGTARTKKDQAADQSIWLATRDCDALIQVIRNHTAAGLDEKSPQTDFRHMEQELILADLVVVEKRLERIEHDHTRGKKMDPE